MFVKIWGIATLRQLVPDSGRRRARWGVPVGRPVSGDLPGVDGRRLHPELIGHPVGLVPPLPGAKRLVNPDRTEKQREVLTRGISILQPPLAIANLDLAGQKQWYLKKL